MIDIELPHNGWTPRKYQEPLWRYLESGGKRAVAIWHRRAGKDEILLHHAAVSAMKRVGNYWHTLPEYQQSRKAIWTAINPHTGKRRIDEAFPLEIRASTNDNEMFIRFINGSTWSLIGSDNYNSVVGASPAGIVFSEYALSNPAAWGYFRPMLEENNGWAAFISTPRGRNHALDLFRYSARTPGWFSELLTARDTRAVSDQALAETLNEYIAIYGADAGRAMYDQELFCSFNAAILGAFYGVEMAALRSEGRILECEPLDGEPVHCAWDIGVRDDTAVIWFQPYGAQLLILDCLVGSGVGVEWFRDEIFKRERERGWSHGIDYVPHDAKILEWGAGRTRVETMSALGLKPMLVPRATMEDGINAARRTLPLCVFHPRTEDSLVAALEQYRREWDDEKRAFRISAVHDWTSHPSDAFRYLAQAWKPAPKRMPKLSPPAGWIIPPPPDQPRRGLVL